MNNDIINATFSDKIISTYHYTFIQKVKYINFIAIL